MAGNGAAKGGGGGGGKAEGEHATVKTSVWWDIENCPVPRGSDPHHIAQNVSSALASLGYKGPVSISSFGDTNQIPEPVKQALHSTGISLNHVPAGVKDASDKKILVDMLLWAIDNPPPANYLLISGDRDFSYALHQLRMRRYDVLLARQPNVSQALDAAAICVWHWKDLVAGLPPLPESPYTSSVTNDGVPSAELSSRSVSDAASMQSSDIPTSGCKTNQKISGNGRDDSRNKSKHVRKLPNQSQVTSSVPRTSADQFRQPSNGSRGVGTNNDYPHMEQNQAHMRSGSVSQDVASVNYKGTFNPQSSPQKLQTEVGNSSRTDAKNLRETPHVCYKAKANTSAGPLSGQIRPSSIKSNQSSTHNKIPEYPQLLKPSDLLSSHSSNISGSSSSNHQNNNSYPSPIRPHDPPFSSIPRPHGPPFSPGPPARGTISDSPISGHHNPSYFPQVANLNSFPSNPKGQETAQIMCHDYMQRPPVPTGIDGSMSNNIQWRVPGCLAPHDESEHFIRNIMCALNVLKDDRMAPTEANIADCIHYGEINIPNFNVKAALDCAILHQVVVMHKLGDNLPFYVGKHDKLWKCVNVMDSNVKLPSATWDVIYSYLRLPAGRSSIMASQCRYHAATILKKSCLNHLVLGDVLQILHVIINIKKWIIPQFQGWQPLSFNVQGSDRHASHGASTGKSI